MILRTLGTFELVSSGNEGQDVRVFGPQKPLALIAYLALAPGRRATRDQLLALLWSDSDPERGRKTLRQTLWSLRQRLGDDALQTDDDWITLTLPLSIDCMEFEAAIKRSDLAAAWARYAGHFIPAFAAPGGVEFEQWADLQRDRLKAAWVASGEQLAREQLRNQQPRPAVEVARRLRDEFPDRLDLWRLLLTALLADGNRMQALVEAEALGARCTTEGWTLDGETRQVLDRIRSQPAERSDGLTPRPRADLIGREGVFAALLTAWQRASDGHGTVALIRGSAGLGKTRLLQDYHQRLVDIGVSVVSVRARPADRDLPFALIASLAEALGPLPGALGVSPATASALVELAPTLSSLFRRSTPEPRSADELLRVRTLALAELLQATSEERPLAILIDDLHWADEPSRQLLASLTGRIGAMPILVVVCLRPVRGGWSLPPGAMLTDLQPLSAEQLEVLASSVAGGDPALLGELGRLLFQMSSGVPLLAVTGLELALERRLLRIVDERWECPDVGQLRQALMQGSVLEQLLRDLPLGGLAMLLGLALAGRPLEDHVLLATADQPAGAPLITALEQRGLLTRAGEAWDIAHDRIAEAVVGMSSPDQRLEVARRVGLALIEQPETGTRTLRVAGRLLAFAGHPEGERCFLRWLTLARRRDYWRHPDAAAAEFLGEDASSDATRRLAAGVSRWSRWRWGYPELSIGALALAGFAGLMILASMDGQPWQGKAVRMDVREPQSSKGFFFTTPVPGSDTVRQTPFPVVVDFKDAKGQVTASTPERVVVTLERILGDVQLVGDTAQPVVLGRADFSNLSLRGGGIFRLTWQAGDLPPVESRRYYVVLAFGQSLPEMSRLQILSGTLNGQALDSLRRTVTVGPGEKLRGALRYRSITVAERASIVMGAVALWGDRRANWMVHRALNAHGEDEFEQPMQDALSGFEFTAPVTPGRYHVVVLWGLETEMRFIASRTNWILGEPRWFDGNDIADLGPAELAELDQRGYTRWGRSVPPAGKSQQEPFTGTTIEVVVR